MVKDKTVISSSGIVFREKGKKVQWFLVRQNEDDDWQIPVTMARRGESSVRSAIRQMSEDAGMDVKAYEEVGRSGGAISVNGEALPQRILFYLMKQETDEEILGFVEADWFEYASGVRKLSQKRDQQMLREANKLYKKLKKDGRFDEEK